MIIYQGIDVSAFQGNVDWRRVRESDIDFAMLRAALDCDQSESQTVIYFHRNAHDAAEAGIELGAYYCSLALTAEEAHREAENFLHIISGYRITYPVAIDIEDRNLRYIQNDILNQVVQAWCGDMRDAGYYPMIRAQLPTVLNRLDKKTLEQFDLWLVKYGESTDYLGDIGIWQYTSAGMVGGVRGRVGRLRALNNYPKITQIKKNPGETKKTAAPDSRRPVLPLTQALDTLYELAALSDVIKELFENSEIKNLFSGDLSANKSSPAKQESKADEPATLPQDIDSHGSTDTPPPDDISDNAIEAREEDAENADNAGARTEDDQNPDNVINSPEENDNTADSQAPKPSENDLAQIFTLTDQTELCTASLADKAEILDEFESRDQPGQRHRSRPLRGRWRWLFF